MYARWLFLAMILPVPALALQISEIMPNPSGPDTNREWIELYNNDNETYNISDWRLVTDAVSHGLNTNAMTEIILPEYYVVIVQNISSFLVDYPNFSGTLIDSSWSPLSNSANETVIIKNASVIFDNVTYQPGGEGNSTCLINGSFVSCLPTPGGSNEFFLPSVNITNATCNITLSIDAPEIYESVYSVLINKTNCTDEDIEIEYWIEDLFGGIVREKTNTTQTVGCHKSLDRSWTQPAVEGSEAYKIFATSCNFTASKIIVVVGSSPSNVSHITITGSSDEIKFGETALVDLEIYRGETGKYAVDIYVRNVDGTKIGGTSKFHAGSKFRFFEVSVPVQLKPNCDGKYSDGTYTIVAEGLDVVVTRDISIKGVSSENCKKEVVTISSGGGGGGSPVAPAPKSTIELLEYPDAVSQGEEFSVFLKLNSTRNYTVYSYVFKGNTPVSEGFDGTRWSASWTANRQSVLGPAAVTLKNRIEDGTSPGIYTLRIKAKSDREEELSRDVEVREKVRAVTLNVSPPVNTTVVIPPNETAPLKITGLAVQKTRPPDSRLKIIQMFALIKTRLFKK